MPGQRIEHRGVLIPQVETSLAQSAVPAAALDRGAAPRGADGAMGFSGAVVAKHREQRPHSNKLSVTLPPVSMPTQTPLPGAAEPLTNGSISVQFGKGSKYSF